MVEVNESKVRRIIKAIVILLILGLIIFLAVLKFKNNNKKIEKKEDNTLKVSEYAYLLNRLYPTSCAVFNITDFENIDNLSNEMRIEVAISNLAYSKVEINEDDEFDQNYLQEVTYDLVKDFKEFGFDAKKVEKKVKEIFGNVNIEHKSTEDVVYDKTTNVYIMPPHGCGDYENGWFQIIDKVIKDNNELHIYTIAGSLIKILDNNPKLCYEDNYNIVKEESCILLNSLDKKYITKDKNNKYNYEKYAVDNKDKFNQYKFTFVKENNNYIIKKMEKIK